MGFWEDFGKEVGKAVVKGAVDGVNQAIQKNKNRNAGYSSNNSAPEQAANRGDIDAIDELATNYYLQMDYQNAIYWARKGAQSNSCSCLYILGEIAFSQENFYDAEQCFMRNVNVNGHIDSACELGFIYLREDIGMKDIEKAFNFFNFALQQNQNYPNAAYGVALCILETDEPDINLVRDLMQLAINSENAVIRNDAQQTLQAIRERENAPRQNNNNNGGCFITTAVCESFNKPDDCFELTVFRNFRDNWLINQADGKNLIEEYYKIAPKIVEKINSLANSAEVYKNIWCDYLASCLKFIETGNNFACKNKYIEMVGDLKKLYL